MIRRFRNWLARVIARDTVLVMEDGDAGIRLYGDVGIELAVPTAPDDEPIGPAAHRMLLCVMILTDDNEVCAKARDMLEVEFVRLSEQGGDH